MEYSDSDKGKCLTCGFLSKHPIELYAGLPTPRFYEAEPDERVSSEYRRLFSHRPDMAASGVVQTEITCFVGAADLMQNIRDLPFNTKEGQQARLPLALEAIAADRHCPSWYPYTRGFSPREHYDELRIQMLEEDRRAFEMQLFQMGQEAQKTSIQIAADSKAIVADLKAIAEKNDQFSRRVTVWVILLAVLQVLGALVTLPSVSWVQRFWHYLFS